MKRIRLLFYFLCMVSMTFLLSSNADAATLKSVTLTNSATYKWDLTHDGKADTVRFQFSKNGNYITKTQIYVNGKNAYTYSGNFYKLEVQYVKISNSKEFLYVVGRGPSHMAYILKIFRYDTSSKKLVESADLSKYTCSVRGITKISGNKLTIAYGKQTDVAGAVKWSYEYEYNASSKKFELKNAKVTAISRIYYTRYAEVGDGYDSYFKKGMYKTAKSLTVYSNRSCTNKTAVVPSGKWMTLKSIYVTPKGTISLQFKYGNRYVWVKNNGNFNDFCGVSRRLVGSVLDG